MADQYPIATAVVSFVSGEGIPHKQPFEGPNTHFVFRNSRGYPGQSMLRIHPLSPYYSRILPICPDQPTSSLPRLSKPLEYSHLST
eukprot:2737138-Amphidinium_carterae.1